MMRKDGIKAGLLQINTIWPFPDRKVQELISRAKVVLVPELNLGQIINEVRKLSSGKPVFGVNKVDSTIITPYEIIDKAKEVLQNV
jgi:2-oxoglutarate ferredoxin oxidoreductase subunit alpha